jgi:hypothetical protein
MSAKSYSTLAGVIFTLMALVQLGRAVAGLHVTAGTLEIPIVASWVAFGVAALLAFLGYTAKNT